MSIKPVRAARVTDTTGALLGQSRVRRRPRNTVKNDVFEHFLNSLRKIHMNRSTRGRHGVDTGSGGGIPGVQQKGRRQGARAYITFGYQPKASGKDTGAWPAPEFMRLTPDSRAPAYLGSGMCRVLSLSLSRSLSFFETWWGLY